MPRLYQALYAIVILPDKRILSLRNKTEGDWFCTVSELMRHDINSSDLDDLFHTILYSKLHMDINKLEGEIGKEHIVKPFGYHGRSYVVKTFYVTQMLRIQVKGDYELKAFHFNTILDMLENQQQRTDFSTATDGIFKYLFEKSWSP